MAELCLSLSIPPTANRELWRDTAVECVSSASVTSQVGGGARGVEVARDTRAGREVLNSFLLNETKTETPPRR